MTTFEIAAGLGFRLLLPGMDRLQHRDCRGIFFQHHHVVFMGNPLKRPFDAPTLAREIRHMSVGTIGVTFAKTDSNAAKSA